MYSHDHNPDHNHSHHNPDDELLRLYSMGALAEPERGVVEHHLATCSACQEMLAEWQLLAESAAVIAQLDPTTLPPLQIPEEQQEEETMTQTWAINHESSDKRLRFPITAAAVAVIVTVLTAALVMWSGLGSRQMNGLQAPDSAVSLLQPTPTLAPEPSECRYRVREGDTILSALEACGAMFGSVELYRVRAVNNLDKHFSLEVGQEIIVPINQVPGQIPNPSEIYTLDKDQPVYMTCTTVAGVGATPASILERCGLAATDENIALLRSYNHLLLDKAITTGTHLTVPLDGKLMSPNDRLLPVWVASQHISTGTVIDTDMLIQVYFPARLGLFPGSQDRLIGRIAREDIPAFVPVTSQNTRVKPSQ